MQNKTLFTVLSSRLGLKHAPFGHSELNLGVEKGGQFLLENLLENSDNIDFKNIQKLIIDFPEPEIFSESEYLKETIKLCQSAKQEILSNWQDGQKLITLGGDHSVAYASLSAVLEKFGAENVGVVMFDSHGDLHLPDTSPSGNFHGMWLRAFFDDFEGCELQNAKILPSQLRFVGNLVLEKEEKDFISSNEISVYSESELTDIRIKELNAWANSWQHLHISFDVDVFSEKLMPATGTPNPNGFGQDKIFELLAVLKNHKSVSLDLVEFNPGKDAASSYRTSNGLMATFWQFLKKVI